MRSRWLRLTVELGSGNRRGAASSIPRGRVSPRRHPEFNRREVAGVIVFQSDVEALILGTPTVIGEIECFLDQAVEIDRATLPSPTSGVFQHAFDDAIGPPPVLGNFFEVAG